MQVTSFVGVAACTGSGVASIVVGEAATGGSVGASAFAWVRMGSVGGTVSVGVFSREGGGLGSPKGAAQAGTNSKSQSNCFSGLRNCNILQGIKLSKLLLLITNVRLYLQWSACYMFDQFVEIIFRPVLINILTQPFKQSVEFAVADLYWNIRVVCNGSFWSQHDRYLTSSS